MLLTVGWMTTLVAVGMDVLVFVGAGVVAGVGVLATAAIFVGVEVGLEIIVWVEVSDMVGMLVLVTGTLVLVAGMDVNVGGIGVSVLVGLTQVGVNVDPISLNWISIKDEDVKLGCSLKATGKPKEK